MNFDSMILMASFIYGFSIETNTYYGEPVELKGNCIYFTSWKYVRQGNFAWPIQPDPNAPDAHKQGAWLSSSNTNKR